MIEENIMSEELEKEEAAGSAGTENKIAAKSKKGKYILLTVMGLLGAGAVAGYCVTAMHYKDHFFPGTVINGIDYSNAQTVDVTNYFLTRTQDYRLDVTGRNLTTGESDVLFTISAPDAGMHIAVKDTDVAGVLEQQNEWGWPAFLWSKGYNYTLSEECLIDEDMLAAFLNNQAAFQEKNMTAPEDAYIKGYSDEEKKYVLEPEVPGTKINTSVAKDAIQGAVLGRLAALDLETVECYAKADIGVDDAKLQKFLGQINTCLSTKVTYDWNGNEVVVDTDLLKDWISVEGNEILVDEEAVREFVNQNAKAYDTYGRDRKFVTTMGIELTLPSGAYGWKTDRDAETEELIELIKAGTSQDREPVYVSQGANKGTEDDIGKSYVEIDLSHQHLYLYQDGEVVLESDFVSGNVSRQFTTPPGVFGLTYKTTNAVLRGQDYATPVNYWMPFNGNIGMHDATWRKAFGGEIYLRSGSHGCINLPLSNAKEIYQYVSKGFPVICYYYSQEQMESLHGTEWEAPPQETEEDQTPDELLQEITVPEEEPVQAPQENIPAENPPLEGME